MRNLSTGAVVLAAASSGLAQAHSTGAIAAPDWDIEAVPTAALVSAAIFYGVGWWRLRRRAKQGRRHLAIGALLFCTGWLTVAGAALSPLHSAGSRSFTLHMLEHELLMLIAAPLLALARPLVVMLWALPAGARQAVGSFSREHLANGWAWISAPAVATLLQIAALWLWHVPALFDRALRSESWHLAQHFSFLFSALLFWWALARRGEGGNRYGTAALYLFATALAGGFLGALMALSVSPWYARYAAMGMAPFGLTPVEDQQLAGLLMWIPGGLVHAGAALVFTRKWLSSMERRRASDKPANIPAHGVPALDEVSG